MLLRALSPDVNLTFYFLNYFLYFSTETERKMVYCNSTWPQARIQLVQSATGSGQRAGGTVLVVMKAVKSQVVSGADGEVPGPLRFVLTAAHCPITCSRVLAFSIPYVCFFSLCGRASRFAWTSASFFFSGSSACAFASSSTLLSWRRLPRKMALRLRAILLFL